MAASGSVQREIALDCDPAELCRVVRRGRPATLFLDGAPSFDDAWSCAPLLALAPRVLPAAGDLDRLLREIAGRREQGGTPETGVAVLLGYERPGFTALSVDRSVRFLGPGRARLTRRGGDEPVESIEQRLRAGLAARQEPLPRAGAHGRPRTSLPREAYLGAVQRVKTHIEAGDVYQANLCQRFEVDYRGDALELYLELVRSTPAPRAAFVEAPGVTLVSASPETFVDVTPDGWVRTWPIKGTRPRGRTVEADREAVRELLASEKDRAELLMIVDLERNDLARVCRVGSVRVPRLAALRSYATVHHLVAQVEGRLRDDLTHADLLRAVFPGGSITGAPKLRAMEILRTIEPVRRGLFTGSLLWFGDDGRVESNILIRSIELDGTRARIGAGGGVVAESEPEQEWAEANHKARALTEVLGFAPEEAS